MSNLADHHVHLLIYKGRSQRFSDNFRIALEEHTIAAQLYESLRMETWLVVYRALNIPIHICLCS